MFLKTGVINLEFGKTYSTAFEKRQKADYDDFVTFTPEEVSSDLENAKKFVEQVAGKKDDTGAVRRERKRNLIQITEKGIETKPHIPLTTNPGLVLV